MAPTTAATRMDHTETSTVRVRPKRTLLRSGVLSFVLVSVPLFSTLYLLSIPLGTWPTVVAMQLLTIGVSLLCLVRYLTSYVGVSGGMILDRAFTAPLVRIPVSRVTTIVLAETYRWNAPDSVPQLLLLDADGHRVDRMRGTFWREQEMRMIAGAVGTPLSHFPEPITMQEFFAAYPAARYWFENRVIVIIAGLIAFTAALVAVPWLMALTGIALFAG